MLIKGQRICGRKAVKEERKKLICDIKKMCLYWLSLHNSEIGCKKERKTKRDRWTMYEKIERREKRTFDKKYE